MERNIPFISTFDMSINAIDDFIGEVHTIHGNSFDLEGTRRYLRQMFEVWTRTATDEIGLEGLRWNLKTANKMNWHLSNLDTTDMFEDIFQDMSRRDCQLCGPIMGSFCNGYTQRFAFVASWSVTEWSESVERIKDAILSLRKNLQLWWM